MTIEDAFKQSEFIKRGYWQGKFLHKHRGELTVSHYPGSSYPPNKEDLAAEDWVPFNIAGDAIV